jgi:hypothetical protein
MFRLIVKSQVSPWTNYLILRNIQITELRIEYLGGVNAPLHSDADLIDFSMFESR